jgi:hypothetical protein
VDVPLGYINVKVLPEHLDQAHQIIQDNVEKLYAPVVVYRQYLGEIHVVFLSLYLYIVCRCNTIDIKAWDTSKTL